MRSGACGEHFNGIYLTIRGGSFECRIFDVFDIVVRFVGFENEFSILLVGG